MTTVTGKPSDCKPEGKHEEAQTRLERLVIDHPTNAEYKIALTNLQERRAPGWWRMPTISASSKTLPTQ